MKVTLPCNAQFDVNRREWKLLIVPAINRRAHILVGGGGEDKSHLSDLGSELPLGRQKVKVKVPR